MANLPGGFLCRGGAGVFESICDASVAKYFHASKSQKRPCSPPAYDQSAAIRPLFTTPIRSNTQFPYDTNSTFFMISIKFVTFTFVTINKEASAAE
jgi:hypothetical protein